MTTEQNKVSGEMNSLDESAEDVIKAKLLDAMTPGFQAEFDPSEADQAGAFIEDALSEEDAIASDIDLSATFDPDTEGR